MEIDIDMVKDIDMDVDHQWTVASDRKFMEFRKSFVYINILYTSFSEIANAHNSTYRNYAEFVVQCRTVA